MILDKKTLRRFSCLTIKFLVNSLFWLTASSENKSENRSKNGGLADFDIKYCRNLEFGRAFSEVKMFGLGLLTKNFMVKLENSKIHFLKFDIYFDKFNP